MKFNEMVNEIIESSGDDVMHPAETGCPMHEQLISKGFTTNTPPQKGFVRSYDYIHPDGSTVTHTVGVHGDHWKATNADGTEVPQYFRTPEPGAYNIWWGGLRDWLDQRSN
jgi:hypothetical protein